MRVKIAGIALAMPERCVSSREVEQAISRSSGGLRIPPNILEQMTGIKTRRYVEETINTSDLAVEACRAVLAKTSTPVEAVELLVFASAGQDLVEPATSHITQEKLGTRAAVMDVKNACNSFLNGIQIAEALLLAGQYKTALVAVGETPSRCIKWKVQDKKELRLSFPGYTFGDAGAAALLKVSEGQGGIFYRKFIADSRYWSIGTLAGGGSMHPRGDEYTYFQGDGTALKDAFMRVGPELLFRALQETATTLEDYSKILVHQVTIPFLDLFLKTTKIPRQKVVLTLPEYGNMAAASLPVGFALAERKGELERGDKVMFIGLAGGISLGIIAFEY
jgi:3-oxoacyl-[acyl-carrier-protein] synthase-3